MKSLSLYIHIPFCKSKCIYCDFNSRSDTFEFVDEYIKKLIEEIDYYGKKTGNRPVKTVYFGGGTPSVIDSVYIERILASIKRSFDLSSVQEITIEANPGTVTEESLRQYWKCGINRISFGTQTFDKELLEFLSRAHDPSDAIKAVELAKAVGFDNVSLDLIFSLPRQTIEMIDNDLKVIEGLDVQHVSVYSLKVEEGTPLYTLVGEGLFEVVDDEKDREFSDYVKGRLENMGFIQYEISNYSYPGFESKHNSIYWTMDEYLGFGLSASSFYSRERYNNVNELKDYLDFPVSDLRENVDALSEDDLCFESIMLGLRLNRGIDLEELGSQFKRKLEDELGSVIERLVDRCLIVKKGSNIALTDLGRDLSNQVFLEFLNEM